MLLKEKGRYYELPLVGYAIQQIVYNGALKLIFSDDEKKIFLDLHGEFQVIQSGHSTNFLPKQKEALALFFDWFQDNITITDAKADKQGQLFIRLSNKQELIVNDGPFENWHFTILNSAHPKDNLFVHGGIGTTYY